MAIKPIATGVSLSESDYPDTEAGNKALDQILQQPQHTVKLARLAQTACNEVDTFPKRVVMRAKAIVARLMETTPAALYPSVILDHVSAAKVNASSTTLATPTREGPTYVTCNNEANCKAGEVLQVSIDGRMFNVTVPEGIRPGEKFRILVPSVQDVPYTRGQGSTATTPIESATGRPHHHQLHDTPPQMEQLSERVINLPERVTVEVLTMLEYITPCETGKLQVSHNTKVRFEYAMGANLHGLLETLKRPLADVLDGHEVQSCASIHTWTLSKFDSSLTLSEVVRQMGGDVLQSVLDDSVLEVDIHPPDSKSDPLSGSAMYGSPTESVMATSSDPLVEVFSTLDIYIQLLHHFTGVCGAGMGRAYCTRDVLALSMVCKSPRLLDREHLLPNSAASCQMMR
jgi:hypothetical protein